MAAWARLLTGGVVRNALGRGRADTFRDQISRWEEESRVSQRFCPEQPEGGVICQVGED